MDDTTPSNIEQPPDSNDTPAATASRSEGVRTIGGLLAVIGGVIVVAIIATAAISKNTQIAATISGSTTGAVAAIVGAYFGVKIGTEQTKQALDAADTQSKAKDREAAKAQVYALNVSTENAAAIQAQAAAAADNAAA
jgi:hypothetical protein